jgi:hypothetical protein
LAAAREKTMTDLVMEWIQREADRLTTDPLLRALQEKPNYPTREYTQEEIDGFLKADAETPQDLIDRARKGLKRAKK